MALQANVKAVTEYPKPRTKRQLRRFIPNCTSVTASLALPTGGQNGLLEMSSEQLAAFEHLKICFAKETTLAFPSPDAQLSLIIYVFKAVIGTVLNQGEGDQRQLAIR